jgi:hypothetical protein
MILFLIEGLSNDTFANAPVREGRVFRDGAVRQKSKISSSKRSPSKTGPKRFPQCVISITHASKVSFYRQVVPSERLRTEK